MCMCIYIYIDTWRGEGRGRGRAGLNSDEAKARSKRTKEQVQAKNRTGTTFQSDTPAGRRIYKKVIQENTIPTWHIGRQTPSQQISAAGMFTSWIVSMKPPQTKTVNCQSCCAESLVDSPSFLWLVNADKNVKFGLLWSVTGFTLGSRAVQPTASSMLFEKECHEVSIFSQPTKAIEYCFSVLPISEKNSRSFDPVRCHACPTFWWIQLICEPSLPRLVAVKLAKSSELKIKQPVSSSDLPDLPDLPRASQLFCSPIAGCRRAVRRVRMLHPGWCFASGWTTFIENNTQQW